MSIVNVNPFPVVNNVDGTPLDQGYLYFGQPNLDPQANIKTVYWDAGFLFPADQPIRTAGGRVFNQGSIAALYVNGNYSMRCLDSNGQQVFINMNVTPF